MRELRADPQRSAAGAAASSDAGAAARASFGRCAGPQPEAAAAKSRRRNRLRSAGRAGRPLRSYLATCPSHSFAQASALSESDAGRALLALASADRVRMVVAAYRAWSAERFGGPNGAGLRRVVSDLLRAKLPLADADAVALAQAAAREGFTYASYSPNQAVLGALERHVAARGLSADLRSALERLLARDDCKAAPRAMCRAASSAAASRRCSPTRSRRAGNTVPLFRPKDDAWGTAVMAKLAALAGRRAGAARRAARAGARGRQERQARQGLAQERRAGARTRATAPQLGAHLLDLIECHEPGAPHRAGEPGDAARAALARRHGGARRRGAPPRSLRAEVPDLLAAAFRLSLARARQRVDPRLQR